MTARIDASRKDDPVPLCLMLSEDEDTNIRLMFDRPARLAAPRHRPVQRRVPVAALGGVLAGVVGAVLVAVRKGLV